MFSQGLRQGERESSELQAVRRDVTVALVVFLFPCMFINVDF